MEHLFCLKMSQNRKTVMMILIEMHLMHLMTSQMMNKHCFEVIREIKSPRNRVFPGKCLEGEFFKKTAWKRKNLNFRQNASAKWKNLRGLEGVDLSPEGGEFLPKIGKIYTKMAETDQKMKISKIWFYNLFVPYLSIFQPSLVFLAQLS